MSDTEGFGGGQPDKARLRTGDSDVLSRMTIEKDKIIFQEGQDSTDVFIIESGRIGVYKTIDSKVVPLAVLEKGAMFGEMAAFTNDKRSATTKALEPCVIVRIPKSLVMKKIAATDPFVKALIDILINNLNKTNERYVAKNQTHDKLLQELKVHAGAEGGRLAGQGNLMQGYVCKIIGAGNQLIATEEFSRKSHIDAIAHAKWLVKAAGPDVGYELSADGKMIDSQEPGAKPK